MDLNFIECTQEQYERLFNAYTITYNYNGGTGNNPTLYNNNDLPITLNTPTKDGFNFTGWTGSNGDIPQITVEIAKGSTGNKTFAANWAESATLNFYNNNVGLKYITKVRVYCPTSVNTKGYTDYTNPSVGTSWYPSLTVYQSQKVVFYHNVGSSCDWRYYDVSGTYHDLGSSESAYFTVPSGASGESTLGFGSSSDSASFYFSRSSTVGWVSSEECCPVLGE